MKKKILGLMLVMFGVTIMVNAHGGYGGCSGCNDYCCGPCDCCCGPCDCCCCCPCDWFNSCCCWSIDVIGEYLLLQAQTCDLNYAISDDREVTFPNNGAVTPSVFNDLMPSGKEHGICPDFQSGFRVGLGIVFECGCKDFTVTYTRLDTDDSDYVTAAGSGGLWATHGLPRYNKYRLNNAGAAASITTPTVDPINAAASLHVCTEYNMVDVVIGKRAWKGCRLWVRGYAGLRWAEICVRNHAHYQGTISTFGLVGDSTPDAPSTEQVIFNSFTSAGIKSESWGVGPRLGVDISYDLCCNFGVGAHTGASILAGQSCQTVDQTAVQVAVLDLVSTEFYAEPRPVDQSMTVHHKSRCALFPQWDARLGLNYRWCCRCFSLFAEVGWEFVTYVNVIGHPRYNDDGGTHVELCDSYNMDGLYVAFRLHF